MSCLYFPIILIGFTQFCHFWSLLMHLSMCVLPFLFFPFPYFVLYNKTWYVRQLQDSTGTTVFPVLPISLFLFLAFISAQWSYIFYKSSKYRHLLSTILTPLLHMLTITHTHIHRHFKCNLCISISNGNHAECNVRW